MLTRGNLKLGRHRIWSFSLPSGTSETCPGMTPTCAQHCYAVAMERYRPTAAAKYQRNLVLTRRRDFARRVRAFLIAHAIRIVRVHVAGDFFSRRYACTWLRIMQRSPRVRFYFYTRSWRVPSIRMVIERMAALPNCIVWYSTDRDTGMPENVPPQVRIAWLMTTADDVPPANSDLIFRIRRLRRQTPIEGGTPICPAEDGVARITPVTCDVCGRCWRPEPGTRIPLPVIERNTATTPSSERR